MLTLSKVKKKIRITSFLETVASAYQEISQREMNEIREMTLKNREFIEKLIGIYSELKRASLLEEKEEKEKKPKKEILKLKKEKIVVFLSANARFYGGLVLDIWKKISRFLEENEANLVVIGRVGKILVEKLDPNLKFFYFQLDDENPKKEEIEKIVEFLRNYQELHFFHGKFKTILTQEITQTLISGKMPEKMTKKPSAFLFEPSREEILNFFEKELMKAFFTQIFLEHRLSRHATRMVAMYRIREKAKERRKELKKIERRLKWHFFDKKQMEITLSSQLWRQKKKD